MPGGTDLIDRLSTATGVWRGRGGGPESGPFVARMLVSTAVAGRAVTLDYEATSDRHGLQHIEHSVLVRDATGRLELHVAALELPGMIPFTQSRPEEFTTHQGPLVARIVLHLPRPGELSYAWWWSRDGSEPREQSRADLHHTG